MLEQLMKLKTIFRPMMFMILLFIIIVSMSMSCCTRKNKHIKEDIREKIEDIKEKIEDLEISEKVVAGYEIAKKTIDEMRIISDDLCSTGILPDEQCLKLDVIYLAIDELIPILDEITVQIFHDTGENQKINITKYLMKLSEFNQLYYDLVVIIKGIE